MRAGSVVLVPDKRGVGGSGGVFQPPTRDEDVGRALLDTLASDAIRYLRTVAIVDSLTTGYFGLSQAGWVLPLAEQLPTGAAFAVIVSGPAVSSHEEYMRYGYGNHGLFVMRGPAKRWLPYYPDDVWTNAIAWVDSVTAPESITGGNGKLPRR